MPLVTKFKIKRAYTLLRSLGTQDTKKVNFIICGTQKGGTSALDEYLREHPSICMADKKEVHFFDNERIFRFKRPSYSIYHSAFSPKTHHKILGEATPIYMYWNDSPKRIWQYNSRMKLIVILRNPIDRAYSHWNMWRLKRREPLSFWEALMSENERCREVLPYQDKFYSYIDRGFYSAQLRRLWNFFPKEQVLILRNEELRNNPAQVLSAICDFLQVDQVLHNIGSKDVFSGDYSTPMSDHEKEYLRSIFEYEIRALERLLGWNCSDWLSG